MPKFGKRSLSKLETCHPDIQKVLKEAIKYVDFGVVEGHRGKELQDKYYNEGKSKLKFPKSKHNKNPSLAVDIVPYVKVPGKKGFYDWNNIERYRNIVFFIRGIAAGMGVNIRLGADWDSDFYCTDQTFHDIPHLELK